LKKYVINFLLFIFSSFAAIITLSFYPPQCTVIKNGTFYQYDKTGHLHSTIVRQDSVQTELVASTLNKSTWKIKWVDDCSYKSRYATGLTSLTKEQADFYATTEILFKIKEVTNHFYVYAAEFYYNRQTQKFADTLWRHVK
jgi:hypothetical protein